MFRRISAVYLVTTALTVCPALAQGNSSHNVNNTQEFVTKAAEGGLFEIQSSQLALKKSQDRDIRDFAQRMIDDHTKANDKLKSLAKNETVPSGLDPEHQQLLSKLQGENGSNFADDFKRIQVSAHEQTIDLFQAYAQKGTDQPIKQFAEQTLPTLKEHLQMAEQITIASNAPGSQNGSQQLAQNGRNFITQETPGTWRASKMIGLGVYNEQNEKVGNINEVLFDRSGKAEGVVIGVGGFLGLGERNVAVPYQELKWSMTPAAAVAANGNPSGAAAADAGLGNPASPVNPAPATGTNATRVSDNHSAAYPDHAILPNASKDQLQNAPQFQYGGAPR